MRRAAGREAPGGPRIYRQRPRKRPGFWRL